MPQELESTMTKKNQTPQNDQRSNVKNPNNPAHKSAGDNRSNQKNPNHEPTNDGSQGGRKK